MNAIPPSFAAGPGAATATGERWAALNEAAGAVAALAGVDPLADAAGAAGFQARIDDAEPWRRARAENGIADLAAIMEPGIAALLAVSERGADPKPAARALWREFRAARDAVLALLPGEGAAPSAP